MTFYMYIFNYLLPVDYRSQTCRGRLTSIVYMTGLPREILQGGTRLLWGPETD
jgi:hypothetical protein